MNFTYSELFDLIANAKKGDYEALIKMCKERAASLTPLQRQSLINLLTAKINESNSKEL